MTDEILTVSSLIFQIANLPKHSITYASGKGECIVENVQLPEGPIGFKRRNDATPWANCKTEYISQAMLWRVVNALNTRIPIQIDRVLGASYNCRTVLETLIAACSDFYICRPNRYTVIAGQTEIQKGHKHLIWKLGCPHVTGFVGQMNVDGYITEVPSVDVYCDAIPVENTTNEIKTNEIDPEIKRIHSQMQVALCESARWLHMRPWVSIEDHGIRYQGKNILEFPDIVKDLHEEKVINNYPQAINVAKHIDCLWFNGGMPFAFEVEHSTGVTSGLTRMNSLRNQLEFCRTNYVVVAADDARKDVLKKAADLQFKDMDLWYMPYSAVSELHGFINRHDNYGLPKDFMKSFMEKLNSNG